jgi:hypothetical protein
METPLNPSSTTAFFNALENWICDGYHVDQRVIARRKPAEDEIFEIWGASIVFHPVPAPNNYSAVVRTETVFAEQMQKPISSRSEIVEIVNRAIRGELRTNDGISVCLRGVLGEQRSTGTAGSLIRIFALSVRQVPTLHVICSQLITS